MLELRKDIFADERDDNLKEIGKPTQRQDMLGHVTATSTFFNDHKLQGMLHLKVLRSPHSHARIRRIDTSEAERHPGVSRIIRGADVPRNLNTLLSLINFGKDDEPTLAVDKVRYKGEPIVAVVADSHREAFEALAKIRVDYDPLPTVFDVEEAMKPGAPVVNETYPKNTFTYHDLYDHQKLRFGDVERGFAEADHILEQRYQMSPIEHAPTETNGSIAAPETNGRYVVYTSTQALFFSLDTCAKILDVPSNKLHFVGGTVGGGFGGKVDTVTEPLAILGAMLTGRPVRYVIGREEEMQYCAPRGAERIFIKDGVVARRADPGAQVALPLRQRRLYAALELRRRQMRGASAGALYDPECPRRRLLRLHQSRAGDGDARLRRHRGRFRHRMPDGQARPSRRHGSDGVPPPQRLSRRRHEGASAGGEEHRADRMRAGRRREGEMAHRRASTSACRRARTAAARAPAFRRRRAIPAAPRLAPAQQRTSYDRPGRRRPPPPNRPRRRLPPPSRRAASTHGATRFSSVFGRRR